MKIISIILIAAFALLGVSLFTGCALFQVQGKTDPALVVATASATTTSTVNTLVDLRQQGQITDDQWKFIKPLGQAVANAVETADKAVQSGDTNAYNVAMKIYRQGIDELLAWKARAQKKT